MDFIHGQLADGRSYQLFNVIDDFNREALAMDVDLSLPAERVVRALGHYLFDSIAEVQEYATEWIWTYNHERPNMALGGCTPKQKLARSQIRSILADN